MIWLYELYYKFFLKQKKINKLIVIGALIHDGYFLVENLMNDLPIDIDLMGMPWVYYFLWIILIRIFHKFFGRFSGKSATDRISWNRPKSNRTECRLFRPGRHG